MDSFIAASRSRSSRRSFDVAYGGGGEVHCATGYRHWVRWSHGASLAVGPPELCAGTMPTPPIRNIDAPMRTPMRKRPNRFRTRVNNVQHLRVDGVPS